MKNLLNGLMFGAITFVGIGVCVLAVAGQSVIALQPDAPATISLAADKDQEFSLDLKAGELCNITSDLNVEAPVFFSVTDPSGTVLIKEGQPSEGYLFGAAKAGTYKLVFQFAPESDEKLNTPYYGRKFTVGFSNKLDLAKGAVTKETKTANGYQAKIINEPGDEGRSYLLVQKGGKTEAALRGDKGVTNGFYFSDDPAQIYGGAGQKSADLYRTTPDKTGDGTPDVAVEYFTGGAHCCYQITFFELGATARQLPTIDTANDRLSATAKRPGGGLRFEAGEQGFAYWNIAYASSPQPAVMYEFKDEKLVPRFDLMKKPAPSLLVIKRKAAAARAKLSNKAYVDPDTSFGDFEDPFWSYMLDLVFTGHEDLAWQYFDLVWPAKKPGKQKFLADFKKQLDAGAYGDWKKRDR